MDRGGTYPDLAMMKGLDLIKDGNKNYVVKSSKSNDIQQLKRVLHQNMFASVNMTVTRDIYDLNPGSFVYLGVDRVAGGHSIVCCGYDEEAKMLIMQNHWGTIWGLKGFFLCPYDVWEKQCNIFCWYERVEASSVKPVVKEVVKEVIKEVPAPKSEPKKDEQSKPEPSNEGQPKA
jgi:hypothetical protein